MRQELAAEAAQERKEQAEEQKDPVLDTFSECGSVSKIAQMLTASVHRWLFFTFTGVAATPGSERAQTCTSSAVDTSFQHILLRGCWRFAGKSDDSFVLP